MRCLGADFCDSVLDEDCGLLPLTDDLAIKASIFTCKDFFLMSVQDALA
jgi:hypothetical protein